MRGIRQRPSLLAVAFVGLAAMTPAAPTDAPDAATLQGDQAIVDAVSAAANARGYAAIGDRLADLQAVLGHAPAGLKPYEARGGVAYVRTLDLTDCLMALAMAAGQKPTPSSPAKTVCLSNPYPVAALLVGEYFDEYHQPQMALAVLERALAWAPGYAGLYAEKGAALNGMGRHDEALQTFKSGLAEAGPLTKPEQKAQLLRGEGFALTELKRYDEAEGAYRQSLELDAKHGHAAEELLYIARVKAGGAPTAPVQVNGRPAGDPK